MKKMLLMGTLMCAISVSYAQKVFQAGNYKGQSQRTYLTVEGLLVEKYQNKGFNWFALQKEQEMVYVSVISQTVFDQAAIAQNMMLTNCFKLDSRRWKRKDQKKVQVLALSNK